MSAILDYLSINVCKMIGISGPFGCQESADPKESEFHEEKQDQNRAFKSS